MSRAPEQLAPSWLPRQQRRHVDRALRRLMRRDVCSVCGGKLKHNSRTFSGLDKRGNVVLAGECCTGQVTTVFGMGFYSDRTYDVLLPRKANTEPSTNTKPTNEQIADAITAYQKVIAETDKVLDDIVRRGGGVPVDLRLNLLDSPWKDDDDAWFKQNPGRSHRVRAPFPGESDKEAAETPAGYALIMLIRQVEPGSRIRARFYLSANLKPVPDGEAAAHALFEMAVQREPVPPNGAALITLIEKYLVAQEQSQ